MFETFKELGTMMLMILTIDDPNRSTMIAGNWI